MDIFEKNFRNCDNNRESIRKHNPDVRKYLINTCDYIRPNELQFILGPNFYKEFEYNGKRIGIFGEKHIINIDNYNELKKFTSLPFSSFMKSLLMSNQHRNYDFYVELDYIDINNQTRRAQESDAAPMLYLIENEMAGCFDFVKNCPYRNLNTHYIDYRINWKQKYLNDLFPLLIVKDRILTHPREIIYSESYKILQNPIKIYNEHYDFVKNEIKNTIGISKQFINNPLSSKIKSFIYKKLYEDKKNFKLFLKKNSNMFNFIKNNDVYAIEFADLLNDLAHKVVRTAGYIMDAYFLARFGRKFDTSFYNIIYAGNNHAAVYSEFFNYIKAILVYDSENSIQSDRSTIGQPNTFFPCIFVNDELKKNSFLFN